MIQGGLKIRARKTLHREEDGLDVYSEEGASELREADEISAEEEGFMMGYLEA